MNIIVETFTNHTERLDINNNNIFAVNNKVDEHGVKHDEEMTAINKIRKKGNRCNYLL